MNAPLTAGQADAIRDLEVCARALGTRCELHFTLDFRVLLRIGDQEFASIADTGEHLASLEAAR